MGRRRFAGCPCNGCKALTWNGTIGSAISEWGHGKLLQPFQNARKKHYAALDKENEALDYGSLGVISERTIGYVGKGFEPLMNPHEHH